jgi:hypothetical protein
MSAWMHQLLEFCVRQWEHLIHMQSEALAAAMQEARAGRGKGIFKRKKAKGPNPLAMKKGKKTAHQQQQHQSGGSQQKPHRKRARRRGTAAAAGGADQAA